MALTGRDLELERRRLKEVLKLLDDKIARMGNDIFLDEEKLQDFRRYTWENKKSMDSQELSQANVENDMETNNLLREREYFKKLYRIKDNNIPLFLLYYYSYLQQLIHLVYFL